LFEKGRIMGKLFDGGVKERRRLDLRLAPPFGGKSVVVNAGETPALLDSSIFHELTLFEQGQARFLLIF